MTAWFFFWLALPAAAQISSGGGYELDRSAIASGGASLGGGNFTARSAIADAACSAPGTAERIGAGGEDLRMGFFNPPALAVSSASTSVIETPSGDLSVIIPAGAQDTPAFDMLMNHDPIFHPLLAQPSVIQEANSKFNANSRGIGEAQSLDIWELNLTDGDRFVAANFAKPVRLSFAYADANGDGMVDGTDPPVHAKTLSVWTLDSANSRWVKVPGATVDTVNHRVSAGVSHLSVYAVLGGPDDDVESVYAYPVPFRPSGPEAGTGPGQTGTEAAGITFTNLPSEGTIEIYTPSGQLVRRLDIPIGLPLAKLQWDARNSDGRTTASGVYIWKVAGRTTHKIGRLMIIR